LNQFKLILSQFRELFLRMTGAQKLSIFLFGGAVFILMMAFVVRATSPGNEKVLFWSVAPSKAAEITSKLRDLRVDYRYENGAIFLGQTEDRDSIMMSLAQEDLLPEDLSFDFSELLKENGFTLTKDERDQRYGIALSNELAKMLMNLDNIVDAKVRISKEEPSPLLKKSLKRTASVQITVRGKRRLSKEEATGIARLIASSVKALTPDQVSIIDSRGKNYVYDDEVDASEKWTLARREERLLAEKIEDYLTQFIPKVKATVAVTLNLEKHRMEIKDYQHEKLNGGAFGALVNNMVEKENSTSKEGSKGVAGAGTDTSAEIKEGDGGTNMDMGKSKKQEEFANSLVQEFIEKDGGEKLIESVSVVVANKKLNGDFDPSLPRGENNQEYKEAKWEDASPSLEEQIAGVIGMANLSKINVSIQEMLLPKTPEPKAGWDKFSAGTNWTLVWMVVFAMIGAFILLSMIKKAQPEEEIIPMPEYEEEVKQSDLPPLKEPEMDANFKQVENRIKELIDDDPVKAAGLVRHWLSGD